MEKSTGGVSFDIRFIDSGNGSENCSSVKSRRLIGIYDGDWSLEEDGAVNALIEKVHGIGVSESRASISKCIGNEDERVELDGRLLNDPVSYGGIYFSCKAISTKLYVPDSFEDNQKIEVVRIALRVGAVALCCSELPLKELKESPTKYFSPSEVDELVRIFRSNVDFGSEWREYREITKDLTHEEN